MANTFNGSLFVIDTAGTTLLRAALAPGEPRDLGIKLIRWVGAAAAGAVVIQDENSQPLFESISEGANVPQHLPMEVTWDKDFKVTTLAASSKVYIYLQSGKF